MPQSWTPPDYAIPSEDEESLGEWSPPEYAVEAKEEIKKPGIFSKIKDFLTPAEKLHPDSNGAVSRFIEGVATFPKSIYEQVDTIGKTASEQLKQKDLHGAFKTITSPLMGPIDSVNEMLEKKALGKDVELPSQKQAKEEGTSQILGLAGLPGKEAIEAYKQGDYAKLAGMGVSAAAMAAFFHNLGNKKISPAAEELPIRHSIRTDFSDRPTNYSERPLKETTPQQDSIAIALSKDNTPRTPANISKETGIPQPSVRRTLSEIDKKKTTQERVPVRITDEIPIRQADKLAKDPYEFAGESIDLPPIESRDFGYSVRDRENLLRTETVDESPKLLGPAKEELPIREPNIVPPITPEEPKSFVNPFERPLASKVKEDIPIKSEYPTIEDGVPREFALPDDPGINAPISQNIEKRPSEDILYDIARKKQKMGEEWTPPSYAKSDEPLAARTSTGKIAIGADVKSLGKVLGTSLYKGDIAPIATKELLQNSVDAVRHLGTEGKIDVILDRKNGIIHVSDNGKGLTREELESVFTDLGASGKRDDVSAAGGFGLAKAAPLLGGKKVEVSSITKDSKGVFHKYSFEGTPNELLEGVDIKHEIVELEPPSKTNPVSEEPQTGTSVKVHVSENSDFYGARQFVKKLSEHSPNVQSKINLGENYGRTSYKTEDIVETQLKSGGKSLATLDSPSATTELIEPHNSQRRTSSLMEIHLSNNGMYQGSKMKYFSQDIPNVPSDLVIDIRSKVPEGHADYPFTANREELRGSVDKQIEDYISENIVKPAIGERLNALKKLYNSMQEITVGKGEYPNTFGRKIAIYDPKGQITSAEMKEITTNSSFHILVNNIASTLEEAMKVSGTPEWRDRLEKVGIIFEDTLHGIHIPNPGSGKSAILVNPFISIGKMSPDNASANILHTILHELGHVEVESPGHNESFTTRLAEIYGKFGARRSVEAQDNILKAIADPNTGIYHSEIQKILSTYKESRRREATTDDLLSGTGIGSRFRGKGQEPIPPSDKSDGEGTTAAVTKLLASLKEAKELNKDQQAINRSERAERFSAFSSVKQGGAAGAAKSLGKLKGEFEKVNPGERLQLSKKETDSLFTAIKKANILVPEKARAYTALFKILNGEKVPQRNELAILDEVFGGGFANEITEMHGGIGLVGVKVGKLANTMKAFMYSSDLSFGLRQGIGMVHKPEWRDAMIEQLKYFAKPEYFDAAMEAIQQHPKYLASRESGLFLAKPGGILNGEEAFMDNYVNDLHTGLRSLYVKDLVNASERAYIGGLNKIRMDLYDNLTDLAEDLGHNVFNKRQMKDTEGKFVSDEVGNVKSTSSPTKISDDIAKYINVYTGRGGLGQLERVKGIMNFIFGSPRMLSSRLTALNPKFYMDLDPFVRKEAIKSLLAVAAASTTINALGALIGGKVSKDILSSDFMKTRFASGNVMDPSGSFQQPIVAAARMIGELNRMASGRKLAQGERNIPQIAGDFLTNKLSPFVGLATELVSARRFTGQGNYEDKYGTKKNVMTESGKRFISIFSQDMYNLLSSDPSFAEAVGLPPLMLLGVGEQSYLERKTGTSMRRMKLP